jgi:non-specific serine/threonine protein kinase
VPWGSPVDIWNLAGLVSLPAAFSLFLIYLGNQSTLLTLVEIWDLFEGEHLFGNIFNMRDGHDAFKHLALMVALIRPPPSEFVRRSETTEQFFDSSG